MDKSEFLVYYILTYRIYLFILLLILFPFICINIQIKTLHQLNLGVTADHSTVECPTSIQRRNQIKSPDKPLYCIAYQSMSRNQKINWRNK